MLSKAKAAGATIFFDEVPPYSSLYKNAVTAWNNALHTWGTANGVTIISSNADLDNGSGYLKTEYRGCMGIHLTVAGYKVLGHDFAKAMPWSSSPIKGSSGSANGQTFAQPLSPDHK